MRRMCAERVQKVSLPAQPVNLTFLPIRIHKNKRRSTSMTFILITDVLHFQVQVGVKGALVLFTIGLKMFYLCTDLNPDQYKQYLLRPSAVTKPLFKAKNSQRITLNYEQKKNARKKEK